MLCRVTYLEVSRQGHTTQHVHAVMGNAIALVRYNTIAGRQVLLQQLRVPGTHPAAKLWTAASERLRPYAHKIVAVENLTTI